MSPNRPIFLELWRIKLPATGMVSILHRLSGLLMVLAVPLAATLLALSLSGPEGFEAVAAALDHWLARLALLMLAWSLLHHLLAGLRHLLLDLGIGLDRPVARASAWGTIGAALAVLVIGWGAMQL